MRPMLLAAVLLALAAVPARAQTLAGVEPLSGGQALVVGSTSAAGGAQDAAFAVLRRGAADPVLVRRLPRRSGAAELRRARRLGDRLYVVGTDGDAVVLAGVEPSTGALTTACGPAGIAELALGFRATPHAMIVVGPNLLIAGSAPDGRAFAALVDADCRVVAARRFELGPLAGADTVHGAVAAADGTIYLLGRDGSEGGSPDASVLRVGPDLAPLRAPVLVSYGGPRDGFYAGGFRNGLLVVVGAGWDKVAIRCLSPDLASTKCNQTQGRFAGGNGTHSHVTAGAVLASGAPLAAGRYSPQGNAGEQVGLAAATDQGTFDSAFGGGDGLVVGGDLGRAGMEVRDAGADATAVWAVGDAGAPFALSTAGDGAAPALQRPTLSANAPVASVAGGSPPAEPPPEPPRPGPGAPGPPAAAPGGAPTAPRQEPCDCAGVRAFVNRFTRRPGGNLGFRVNWTLRCNAGPGPGCHAVVRPGVPRGTRISYTGRSARVVAQVECGARCGRVARGSERVTWRRPFRSLRGGRTYRVPVALGCANSRGEIERFKRITLRLRLKRGGAIDFRRSDLDGDGGPDRGRLSFSRVG